MPRSRRHRRPRRLYRPARPRRRRIIPFQSWLTYVVIVIIAFILAQTARSFFGLGSFILGVNSTISAEQVLAQTNQARLDQGLASLRVNDQLSQAALQKAQDMLEDQYWAHVSPTKEQPWTFIKNAGYDYRTAGENLARDFLNTPEMMVAWLDSPTHRQNILNPEFEEIGVAVVKGTFEGEETTLVVQMFGTPAVKGMSTKPAASQPAPAQVSADQPAAEQPAVLSSAPLAPGPFSSAVMLELLETFFATVIIATVLKLIYDGLRQHSSRTTLLGTR